MDDVSSWEPIYREPGPLARIFVQTFALTSPLLIAFGLLLPAGVVSAVGTDARGITFATVATLAYASVIAAGIRAVRRLASRFTPPLTLPGDIWNIGIPEPPRRSRNWPIRFRRRRGPNGGVAVRAA